MKKRTVTFMILLAMLLAIPWYSHAGHGHNSNTRVFIGGSFWFGPPPNWVPPAWGPRYYYGEGAHVDYNDPYVPMTNKMRMYDLKMSSVPLTEENLRMYDCVVISTAHSDYDYQFIADHAPLIIDTRNAMRGIAHNGKVAKA